MATYWELLKHPKWQEKRLVIMQRAGFACEHCFDEDTTLNVHHSFYEKGAAPWEYPDESLHCLCEPCHKTAEEIRKRLNRAMGALNLDALRELTGMAMGLHLHQECPGDVVIEDPSDHEIIGMVGVQATHGKYMNDVRAWCVLSHPNFSGKVDAQILWESVDRAKGRDQVPLERLWDDNWFDPSTHDADLLCAASG